MVELFRQKVEEHGLWKVEEHDYFTLRRFLRARTYDLERALVMFRDFVNWRAEHSVDTILTDFEFTERAAFLDAYPQGYHKLDKQGRPIYIQLIGKIDVPAIYRITDEERMFKFHVQEYERCVKVIMPICSQLAKRKIDQTFGIMDVKGVGLTKLTGDVKRMLGKFTKTDQDNYPEMLGHICIINAPAIFRMVWNLVKGMIDVRTQQKIELLGPNYMEGLLKHVDIESIPDFLGGKSKGSLLDDVGPWSDKQLMARMGIDLEALRTGATRLAGPGAGASVQQQLSQSSLPLPSPGRAPSEREGNGFVTPQTSLGNSGRFGSGDVSGPSVTEVHANGRSQTAPLPPTGLGAIAEHRSRALIERIKAIESKLPPSPDRARTQGGAGGDAVSTRSAAEGSLLNRVEVLEEALERLLVAQEELINQVQAQAQQLAAQQAAAAAQAAALQDTRGQVQRLEAAAAKQGCCTIM
ncbi:hypothetical protein GPECTOR_8g179 [Gonium pectorale]|uniref:CRAL-TRIO domain-containing protein n=1 Tax=Gonium pectorale TaxID=33097 RepID=A0A150GSK6_GONPE|nr:hypothetical protein GPECTOR_8g179 [Gonium pectorale]|eukprot:KXZ52791.1 hypothetical protein GPECTOR_8g179 [Gonium pectorale]